MKLKDHAREKHQIMEDTLQINDYCHDEYFVDIGSLFQIMKIKEGHNFRTCLLKLPPSKRSKQPIEPTRVTRVGHKGFRKA